MDDCNGLREGCKVGGVAGLELRRGQTKTENLPNQRKMFKCICLKLVARSPQQFIARSISRCVRCTLSTFPEDHLAQRWPTPDTLARRRRSRCIPRDRYRASLPSQTCRNLSWDEYNPPDRSRHKQCLWFQCRARQLRRP